MKKKRSPNIHNIRTAPWRLFRGNCAAAVSDGLLKEGAAAGCWNVNTRSLHTLKQGGILPSVWTTQQLALLGNAGYACALLSLRQEHIAVSKEGKGELRRSSEGRNPTSRRGSIGPFSLGTRKDLGDVLR